MTVTQPIVGEPTVYVTVCELEQLLGDHITVDKPEVHWCQLGSPVMTCTSYAVGCSGVREEALFPAPGNECQMLEVLDLVGAIARECSFEADENGFTDPAQVEAVSALQDHDVTALRTWAKGLSGPAFTVANVSFISEGGLAITTLSTSVYSGWT